ncbi:RNA ligase [Xanthomonas phage BUDD]|nr:RNA ligase [Xanthomonas phage BUDD]
MYLSLSDFDHLRDEPTVRFREETINGNDVVIISYMLSNDALWKMPLGVECRGITFNKVTGKLISLPFEKFFNVNEKEHTQEHVIRDYLIQSVLDKRDGSMITPAFIGGAIALKTKKTFFSDVALAAQRELTPELAEFCEKMLSLDFCPIFEYTDPDCKIVLDYGKTPELVLLAMRDMTDGKYLSYEHLVEITRTWNVRLVPNYVNVEKVSDLLTLAATAEDIEGWVIYTSQGRFKVKTKWYCDRHHLIDIRERDIATLVLEEKLDDLMPNLIAGEADMEAIREIERRVTDGISQLMDTVAYLGLHAGDIAIGKARADWVNDNCGKLAKFVHRAARGVENSDESFKEFYRQHYLSTFSLRSIGNPNFRDEEE